MSKKLIIDFIMFILQKLIIYTNDICLLQHLKKNQ